MQLPPISVGDHILDLVVIGCGPAGLALAAESAKLGLKVGLIGPDLPFTNNYGVWEDEFKGESTYPKKLLCATIRCIINAMAKRDYLPSYISLLFNYFQILDFKRVLSTFGGIQ